MGKKNATKIVSSGTLKAETFYLSHYGRADDVQEAPESVEADLDV